jgi:hypothetical protein
MRTALIVAVLLVALPAGVFAIARSSAPPHHARPPVDQVRLILVSILHEPFTCTQKGEVVTCAIRNGSTCTVDLGRGTGGCPNTQQDVRTSLHLLSNGKVRGGATWYPPSQ